MVRSVARWSGLFLGSIGVLGCGSSTTGATDANAGASGSGATVSVAGMGTGGAHAGASSGGGDGKSGSTSGGGNAGDGASDSMASACAEYVIAGCERDQECGGQDPQVCLFATPRCPDVVFSAGSTRTVAGLKACAKTYKTFACDALARGEVPDCVSPGTRHPGESCLFSAQCASLACKTDDSGGCGVCVARAKKGESCSAPNTACAYGLSCSGGVCVINGDVPASVGEACTSDKECPGLDCSSADGAGMACIEFGQCASGLDCACANGSKNCPGDQLHCVAVHFAGDTCNVAGAVCHDAFECVAGVCQPRPITGAFDKACTL